jgi:hypothetical protein
LEASPTTEQHYLATKTGTIKKFYVQKFFVSGRETLCFSAGNKNHLMTVIQEKHAFPVDARASASIV